MFHPIRYYPSDGVRKGKDCIYYLNGLSSLLICHASYKESNTTWRAVIVDNQRLAGVMPPDIDYFPITACGVFYSSYTAAICQR